MNVNLHIERLIVDGVDVDPAQRRALKAVVESELGQLLKMGGMAAGLSEGAAVPRIAGRPIDIQSDNSPVQLGRQIASSVYGGIGK